MNLHNGPSIAVLGAYGTFGTRITRALLEKGFSIVAMGRSQKKLEQLKNTLTPFITTSNALHCETMDITDAVFSDYLSSTSIQVVIHTCGPFQQQDYTIALTCIRNGIHYIDLADDPTFVGGIHALDTLAKQHHVCVVSGASTVPALSSAVIDALAGDWPCIHTLQYGISPGQQTPRGLATTQSVLSYLGKPLAGRPQQYGWQGLYRQSYPTIGQRLMGFCNAPDAQLLPQRYPIEDIKFYAGMESNTLHCLIWTLSWLVRWGWVKNPGRHAAFLLHCSHFFDRWGSQHGGMHMILNGIDQQGHEQRIQWFIEAKDNSGPEIPAAPAVILASELLTQQTLSTGAQPCVGLISLPTYLKALSTYPITITCVEGG